MRKNGNFRFRLLNSMLTVITKRNKTAKAYNAHIFNGRIRQKELYMTGIQAFIATRSNISGIYSDTLKKYLCF
jgi:hypothetical protein